MDLDQIKPCVVGLGKLGLPLATVIADAGFETYGIEKNELLVSDLNTGNFDSPEPNLMPLLRKNKSKLNFVSNLNQVVGCNIFFLIVPTPSLGDGKFDNQYLLVAISDLLESWSGLSGVKTLVIVSTVMPGTCENEFLPLIQDWESEKGNNLKIHLLYSPEFIALGTVIHNLRNPDMTLIGCHSREESKIFLQVMERVTNGHPETQVLTLTEAEVVKIMVNCFVTMKISFANFIGEISSILPGADKYKISKALGMDSRIGGKYLRPGLGFAGPCFPRDNRALIAFAAENGLKASLGIATDEINKRQPENVVKQISVEFPNAKSVGILGITYKPNSKVIEESQTVMIGKLLLRNGLEVKLYDPLLEERDLPKFVLCDSVLSLVGTDLIVVSQEFEFLIEEIRDKVTNLLVI